VAPEGLQTMCIIFYNEKGVPYSERELRNAFRTNDDGAGIMWVENDKVMVHHEMITREDDLVALMKNFVGIPHALHLRYATNGPIVEDLCHPFKATPDHIQDEVWLMHNGVLYEHGKRAEKHESDTLVFARDRAADVAHLGTTDIFFDDAYIAQLEKIIVGDRMIFLRGNGDVAILNPHSWHIDKDTGMWYSNQYSIADRPRYSWSLSDWKFTDDDFPLSSASKASSRKSDDDVDLEKTYAYPGGSRFYGTPIKSAEESAKVLLAENPVSGVSDDDVLPTEEPVLFFRWEGDDFVACSADEADIEVAAEEYYRHWVSEQGVDIVDEDDEIEWD
jgi:hypothetical protein